MKVCVIGAGPSGLTTLKQVLDEGHDVTCFEKNGSIGGIWSRNDDDDDQMKAYDDLILTISAKLMSFSDFMVEGDRIFFTRERYFAYLETYADKFELRERIQLNTPVTGVHKLSDGMWRVTVMSRGACVEHTFEAVAICSGPFQSPNMDIVDLDQFTGEVVHSSLYRTPDRFRDRRILVVGLAESGADILRQISDVASECTLSIRSYSFLLPRLFCGKYSTDALTTRAHHYETFVRATGMPYRSRAFPENGLISRFVFSMSVTLFGVATVMVRAIARVASVFRRDQKRREHGASQTNNLGEPILPLKADLSTEWTQEYLNAIDEWNRRSHANAGNWSPKIIFCKNVSFIPNVVNERLSVNDSGIERITGRLVHFRNKKAQEFDAIVLCTGFHQDFSRLGPATNVKDNNVRNLYKHAFYPEHDGRLALIGFVRPFSGGIPICAEMQARYFALLCSRKLRLPKNVEAAIQYDKTWEEKATALSPRHTEAIPSQSMFLDSLAREIGCLMPMWELIIKPRLLVRHWFYPFNQACYRLTGPHSMHERALKEIMSEKPGPAGSNGGILALVVLSMLPHFVHPKDMNIGSLPGEPSPPATSHEGRDHFLQCAARKSAGARNVSRRQGRAIH